jgi:hypothetical protein
LRDISSGEADEVEPDGGELEYLQGMAVVEEQPAHEPTPTDSAPEPPAGTVPREVADLAAMIRGMAAHSADTGQVSLGDLSRQLGLPVAKVHAGLTEIARAADAW